MLQSQYVTHRTCPALRDEKLQAGARLCDNGQAVPPRAGGALDEQRAKTAPVQPRAGQQACASESRMNTFINESSQITCGQFEEAAPGQQMRATDASL